jgi:hypothetical protein
VPRGDRLVRRDVVILACAISAGIHGALAPAHFAENTRGGIGFVAATALLVPVLHPEPEPVDALALATKAVEAVGLLVIVASCLQLKGTLRWTGRGPSAPSHSH